MEEKLEIVFCLIWNMVPEPLPDPRKYPSNISSNIFTCICFIQMSLKHCFKKIFNEFAAKFLQNFRKFSQISLKYSNLGIIHSKIVEILRDSGKNPVNFDENLQNLLSSVKICKNSQIFAKNLELKQINHRKKRNR